MADVLYDELFSGRSACPDLLAYDIRPQQLANNVHSRENLRVIS